MIEVRIEKKPSFMAAGEKVWISGQDNEQFAAFWRSAHENGLVDQLRASSNGSPVTGASVFGLSCVDDDPNNRAFDFWIATEVDGDSASKLPRRSVASATWAVFSNHGESLPKALFEAEMYAFMQWLPASGYRHAHAPELEVYPDADGTAVEFWLPIEA